MQIRIVGSIGDHEDIHLIKNVTEVFIVENRIKKLIPTEK